MRYKKKYVRVLDAASSLGSLRRCGRYLATVPTNNRKLSLRNKRNEGNTSASADYYSTVPAAMRLISKVV